MSNRPVRVFVADDDAPMCELLSDVLASALGDRVCVKALPGGDELRRRLDRVAAEREPPPALIVSDVQMPHFGGLDALRWVREHLPHTAVVLITAFGDAPVHERARALGAAALLDKPFSSQVLLEHVRRALIRHDRGELTRSSAAQ